LSEILSAQIRGHSTANDDVDEDESESQDKFDSSSKRPASVRQSVVAAPIQEEVEGEEEEDDLFRTTQTHEDPYDLFSGASRTSSRFSSRKVSDSSAIISNYRVTANHVLIIQSKGSIFDLLGDAGGSSSNATDRTSLGSVSGGATRKPSFSQLFGESNDDSLFDEVPETKPVASTAAAPVVLPSPAASAPVAASQPSTSKKSEVRGLGEKIILSIYF